MVRFNVRSRNQLQSSTTAFENKPKRSLEFSPDFLMLRTREKDSQYLKEKSLSTLSHHKSLSPIDIATLQISQPSSINSQLDLTTQPASLPCLPSSTNTESFINRYTLCSAFDTFSSNSTYIVSNNTLPKRTSNGYALNYYSYIPSLHNTTNLAKTKRRARINNNKRKTQKQITNKLSKPRSDVDLDIDTLARRRNKLLVDDFTFIPIEKRIRTKVIELRRLSHQGELLGDFEKLKTLVSLHESNISHSKKQLVNTRQCILQANRFLEATINISQSKSNPIWSRRSLSALKDSNESYFQPNSFDHQIFSSTQQHHLKPNINKLSRKSSKLRILGNAGSTLFRKLSKSSQLDQTSICMQVEPPTSIILDSKTIQRLKSDPDTLMKELQDELQRLILKQRDDMANLKAAQNHLAEKKEIHDSIMETLDLFYGSIPGWEENPISQIMFPETADMTEAGLEAERDLVDTRLLLNRAQAAFQDYVMGANAMLVVSSELTMFIQKLGALMVSVDESEPVFLTDGTIESKNEDLHRTILTELERHITKTYNKCRMAAECCALAPPVAHLRVDLHKIKTRFDGELNAVEDSESVCQCDLQTIMQASRTALLDSRTAETFVIERRNLIGEDLVKIESQVDRCEEYVIMERLGILDMHHPADELQ